MFSSVLESSVIIAAARAVFSPHGIVPALCFCLHIPELIADALFFRQCLLGLLRSEDLPIPCGQIPVVLFHKLCGLVIYIRLNACTSG